ncbi:tripartite tricarboxylate transporter TctB family protein [Roseomonas nepalensis]|uniref:Tripartite tricarboxylate transporter TctB family protein n=1 Tax=Muricoccus nepalensis TaxID=1854500 RepID=A0A502G9M0_9PROT|nr:tripartite tricarboxylate transporter TctB family protein [Roseomonas nepalensis]TPG57726.1 tripartite tricarboxylate transporter TctB family protein [Roseomonas nepalensis]
MLRRLHLELGFAACVFLVGLVGLRGTADLDTGWTSDGPQAGFFPLRVSLILMAASALVALNAWRARVALSRVVVVEGEGGARVLRFGLPILGMVLVAQWLGLYVAMALYLLGAIRFAGGRRWTVALGVAIGVTAVTFVVFERWFSVPLLKGPLEVMLGLG